MYQTNKQVEEEFRKKFGYHGGAWLFENALAFLLSQRAKDLEGIEEIGGELKKTNNHKYCDKSNNTTDAQKCCLYAEIYDQAISDFLSHLQSLKQTNE